MKRHSLTLHKGKEKVISLILSLSHTNLPDQLYINPSRSKLTKLSKAQENNIIMASTLSYRFLCLFLSLSISSPFAYAASHHHDQLHLSSAANLTKLQAEKMIRAFNLFPKHSINMPTHVDSLVTYPQIVEKPLNLNILGGLEPSVQDLGHHAGYYKLPHAEAAR